ncbi:MAG TPA: YfhO family protein [Acidimicrobiales bacterium]|nr:YfhO family protein [Acidimicrobiales bacterium]
MELTTEPERSRRRGAAAGAGHEDAVPARPTRGPWRAHLLAVLWLVAVAVAVMVPAIAHGGSFGPFDLLSRFGLNAHSGVFIHNRSVGDQIRLFVPWIWQSWTQVHQGHLPLWNSYSVMGMPLAFNWESAPFSVGSLIGYLFPVQYAYTVQVIVTMIVAGTGAYAAARVLRLGWIGSVMAATVFELSGPLQAWLGWPIAAVMAWGGWLLAATLLILQGRRRVLGIVVGALALAAAVYAGDPEGVLLLGVALAVFVVVWLGAQTRATRDWARAGRSLLDLAVAGIVGAALGAPILLPGIQLGTASNRTAVGPGNAPATLPLHNVAHFLDQAYNGLPLAGSRWFGFSNYEETAAYVGIVALVLAAAALGIRRRRRETAALWVVVVAMASLIYLRPLVTLMNRLVVPTYWLLAATPLALALAVLSGIGLDGFVRSERTSRIRAVVLAGFGVAGLVLAGLWFTGRGGLPYRAQIRLSSFTWPVLTVLGGVLVSIGLLVADDPRRQQGAPARRAATVAGAALLVLETVFLVAAGAPLKSSSPTFAASTAGTRALTAAVGDSLVGQGDASCLRPPTVGIWPNMNIVYGVREFAVYDPVIPHDYFRDLRLQTGRPAGAPVANVFCPVITTADIARRYGIAYVLELPGHPGPTGSVHVGTVGGEELFRIPGAAFAVAYPLPPGSAPPSIDAVGTPVMRSQPDASRWSMHLQAPTAQLVRIHLTAVPGWHATIDGHPLALKPYTNLMFEARIPPGSHTVELSYWPSAFSAGLLLAVLSALGLAGLVFLSRRRAPERALGGMGATGNGAKPAAANGSGAPAVQRVEGADAPDEETKRR